MVEVGLELESNMHGKNGKITLNSKKHNKRLINMFMNLENSIKKRFGTYCIKHDIEAGYRQVEVKSCAKSEAHIAAMQMLSGMILLLEQLGKEGYIMPVNETLLAKYDQHAKLTAAHIIDASMMGSKRAKMLIPFLIRFFERMDDCAKQEFGIYAKTDIEHLECVKTSTTLNSGIHVNLDISKLKVDGNTLLERVNGKNSSYRYVSTNFEYIKTLEKVLIAITPLIIRHTAISPYMPVAALSQKKQNQIMNACGNDVIAVDSGGTSSRIMLMYSLNPPIELEGRIEVYGHAAYLKYWNLMRLNSFSKSMLTLSLSDCKLPFHTYGSIIGLSRYLLDRFGLVGLPERNNQNPEIAMHWLPISHPYAYPKSMGNGDGARPALEYKLMGGSVEGILSSVLLSAVFDLALRSNIKIGSGNHIQYDRETNAIVLPQKEVVMRKIKKAIAKRNSRALDEYIKKSAESLKLALDDRYVEVLDRVMSRTPWLRVIELAGGKQILTSSDAARIVKALDKQNREIARSDLEFIKSVF